MYPSNVWHIIWKLLISSNYRFHFYSFMAHAYYQYKYHWPELGDKKPPIFVFNLFYIACIEWTDYCTTDNGGKSTAHVVPALIRVCGLSGGSRGGARGAQPPLIFRPKWGPKGRKKFFFEAGVPPPLISGSGSANGIFCFLQCLISCSVISVLSIRKYFNNKYQWWSAK